MKKDCFNCAYCSNVPGSAHKSCNFNWIEAKTAPPLPDNVGVEKGWYMFPLNYDPVWQREECPEFATTKDDSKVIEPTMKFILAYHLVNVYAATSKLLKMIKNEST